MSGVESMRARLAAASTPVLRARLYMLLSGCCFAGMIACSRYVSQSLHPFETAFFRSLFGLVFLVPFFVGAGRGVWRTARPGLHLARSCLQAVYMLTTFYAVTLIPLAEFTALGYSAPLFAVIGAVLVLGERADATRLGVMAVGFGGVLLIVRPGMQALEPGALMVVGASAIWAACLLIIKALSRTDSAVTITGSFAVLMTVLTFPAAALFWQWPSAEQLAWLALIGVLGNSAHMTLAQALKTADIGAVLPLDYLRLVWAAVLGAIVFAQVPDAWTWAGGTVIFASATWLTLNERRAKAGAERG